MNSNDKQSSNRQQKGILYKIYSALHKRKRRFLEERKLKKRLNKAKNRINKQQKRLLNSVTISIGKNPAQDISEKLVQLDNAAHVLERQKKWEFVEYGKWVVMFLGILVVLAVLPGRPVPAHVEVQSQAVEMMLGADFEWSGSVLTAKNNGVLLSHFTEIDSPQSPKLSKQIQTEVLQTESTGELTLESLFIPKGAKLWIEYDESLKTLLFVIAPDSTTTPDNLAVRAEFKMYGQSKFYVGDETLEEREPIDCPMEDDCSIARRVMFTSALDKIPRLRFTTNDRMDMSGIQANRFSFSKYSLENTKRFRSRCTVKTGTYQFRGDSNASNLRKGECIVVESNEGSLGIELPIDNGLSANLGFQVWYHGITDSLRVGTAEFAQERTPSLLAFIMGLPGVSSIGSILGVILAASFAVVRIRK